jgi:hypothetical protein
MIGFFGVDAQLGDLDSDQRASREMDHRLFDPPHVRARGFSISATAMGDGKIVGARIERSFEIELRGPRPRGSQDGLAIAGRAKVQGAWPRTPYADSQ